MHMALHEHDVPICCCLIIVNLRRTACCLFESSVTASLHAGSRRHQQELSAWRKGTAAGATYTGENADMPTVGVLGGGQLGKMLATAAVSCAPATACSCISRQLNMITPQHHSTAWQ